MGQQDVYRFLQEHPGKWFTSNDIKRELGISQPSICDSLKKLRKRGDVIYRKPRHENEPYEYMIKE